MCWSRTPDMASSLAGPAGRRGALGCAADAAPLRPAVARRRLPPLVPGRHRQGRAGRERAGARHHGHPPLRLRASGSACRPSVDAPHQGRRGRERLLPALHPRDATSSARPSTSRGSAPSWPWSRMAGGKELEEPVVVRPTSETRHRRVHGEVDPVATATCRCCSTSGPTSCAGSCARASSCAPPSSSGRRATPPTPPREDAAAYAAPDPPRRLRRLHGRRARDARAGRASRRARERFAGAINTHDLRGHDGRRQGPADGHQPRAGPELRRAPSASTTSTPAASSSTAGPRRGARPPAWSAG